MIHVPDVPTVIASKTLWPQWIGGIGATLVIFVCGMMGGWSSPYLAKLLSDDTPLFMTEAEVSWIASLLNIGRLIGGVLASICVEYFGSKRTMFLIGFPSALGWILMMYPNHVAWLYAARIFCGIGMGMSFGTFPLYLGEISDARIRGALVSLALNGAAVGTVTGNLMGSYLSMTHFSIIALVPIACYVILFAMVPESPHHLLRVGKFEEAEIAFAWYHRGVQLKKEIESLKEFVFASKASSIGDRLRELRLPQYRKAGVIIIVLFMFMHLSGLNSILFYTEIILVNAKVTSIAPSTIVIFGGCLSIVAGWGAIYLVERSGRRFLLCLSSVGILVATSGMGLQFALIEYIPDLPNTEWLPIVSILIYQIFYCLGILIVPSAVLSELFPANLKSIAACGGGISSGVFAFISSKTYQPMTDALGSAFVFWIYGFTAVLAVPFAIFIMPETKGKSLMEIQEILTKDARRPDDKEIECGVIERRKTAY